MCIRDSCRSISAIVTVVFRGPIFVTIVVAIRRSIFATNLSFTEQNTIQANNIPIISEVEFAFRYSNAKVVSITGSNGKTTTSLLLGHILKKAGFDVLIAGNIGVSFALSISERDYKYIVLELSSFQLDDIKYFRSEIAIILNITPPICSYCMIPFTKSH